ncbi:hypothetical protein K2Z83_01110 [Oscillochloris sp. ZM17-4]|uniref:hypothetical protein n=1 Tax=Oscillochloris sp. ZM17-4 TaxID=2866714 RepID=UPI001C72EA31|nr:hypothetical protein [Oscillochloris sp. ZM17-4]MBX0326293.1 hypothetical protein [Oscillochloris sp. ZM17-4]
MSDLSARERRFDRGAWMTIGGILVFSICQLLVFLFLVAQPTDGCLGQTIRTCVGGWPTPLRPGDEILQVAGRSVSDDLSSMMNPPVPAGWVAGAEVPYVVRRDGVELTLQVPLQSLGAGEIVRMISSDWTNHLINLLSLLVAAVAFGLRPGSSATRLLLIAQATSFVRQMLSTVLISLNVWSFWQSPLIALAAGLLMLSYGWLGLPALLLLVLSFPIPIWPVSRWPKVSAALIFGFGLAAALAASSSGNFLIFLAQLGLYAALIIIAILSSTFQIRARNDDPLVRAQSAWIGYGFAIYCLPIPVWIGSLLFPSFGAWLNAQELLNAVWSLGTNLALPICLAIAITRYRLFDIAIIIRRTLVYAALTFSLVTIYLLGVVALQALFVRLTGQESTLAVVASTLAIAALFQPLRRWVQRLIDRRFFRRKYDSRQVLEEFARRAQQESDIDMISADILSTVQETLEPEKVSLWIARR